MTEEECEADDLRRQRERFRPVAECTADPRHVFVIMTCRGRESLMKASRASLDFDSTSLRTVVVHDDDRLGQAQTFFGALLYAAELIGGFTYLTVFEDDIVAAKNALLYIATTKIPDDVVMVSWFHRLAPHPPQTYPVWAIERAAEFSHQQAITLPAKTVHALLDSKELREWSTPHGADMLIGQVMPEAKVAYHFPCLVDHVGGEASLTGNVGARRAVTFVGEDFDALDLTR